MNKKILFSILIFSVLGFSFATVGWPLVVGNIYCNTETNLCKVVYEDFGWRGLPTLVEFNLKENTQNSTLIEDFDWFSMNGVELDPSFFEWLEKMQEINISNLWLNFEYNLEWFNKLFWDESFETKLVPPHIFSETWSEYYMSWYITNFARTSTIKQANQILSTIDFTTCRLDNVNYRWFWIPWKNILAIVLSTNHSDCFEWWYIEDFIDFAILWETLPSEIFLTKKNEIQNFDERDWVWPAMNQTTWWVFFELSSKDLSNWIKENPKTNTNPNFIADLWNKILNFFNSIF